MIETAVIERAEHGKCAAEVTADLFRFDYDEAPLTI